MMRSPRPGRGRTAARDVPRTGTAEVVALEPAAALDPAGTAERPANSIDRYSLALQLIQVFPIVSSVALALVTVTWIARVTAAASLLVGTVWVVWQERSRRHTRPRGAAARRTHAHTSVVARLGEAHIETSAAAAMVEALLNSPALRHAARRDRGRALDESAADHTAAGEYGGEYREVTISIRISSPASSAFRHRYRRRRLREVRSRPASPRGELPDKERRSGPASPRPLYRATKSAVSPK